MSQDSSAAATLTIDRDALRANWRLLAERCAPAECAGVVKADGYGIGATLAGKALAAEGCRTFFVARLSEGEALRAALPEATIYVLDGLLPGSAPALRAAGLRPALGSFEEIAEWRSAGGGPAALHVDTGMNRLGMTPADAAAGLKALGAGCTLLMSHFASSENTASPDNEIQIQAFNAIAALNPNIPASLCNSSGIFLPQRPLHALARPGYALYGGNPTPGAPNPMRAVIALEAPIAQVRRVPAGARVGYNGQWTARRPTTLAIIPVGYADGIPRGAMGAHEKAGAPVAIAGARCAIAGRVSMDLIAIDATDAPPAAVRRGAPVELIGPHVTLDAFAEGAGTIGYEILTNLGRRYRRRVAG
ncbi:MAG: alanine racemase [Hyphomicrobiales bacterium]|nr:alanine racemase [Hyphomicrobiales bacterium]